MKKTIIAMLMLIAYANSGNLTKHNINKCTKLEDRLICSIGSSHAQGFVYFFNDKKLYDYETSTTIIFGTDKAPGKLRIHKAKNYQLLKDEKGRKYCEFTGVSNIEDFYCYQDHTKHYFTDKYGFGRDEILKGKGFNYCDSMFNKLLP